MEELRSWAASVIAAAVLAGVTEFVLPKGNLEKSVKVLLSLVMLITFLSPAVGLFTQPKQIQSGLDKLLDEYEAQQALEQTVTETLERDIVASVKARAEAEGVKVAGVKAVVSVGNDNIITVERIEITMEGTAEDIKAMDEYVFQSFSVHPTFPERNTKVNEDEAVRTGSGIKKR